MEIICSRCGSLYKLRYTRTIMRDKDSLDCEFCGCEIYSWNEAKIWSAVLIKAGKRGTNQIEIL